MAIVDLILHFFTPKSTNNHRSVALSPKSLFFYAILILAINLSFGFVSKSYPEILGYATNISVGDLLRITNQKRVENGGSPLKLNDRLNSAAAAKAGDMFSNQYWAHNSPSGKKPWTFVSAAGYSFVHAGENLARDFSDSGAVVDAWMNSSSHRENLLNSRYQDVGFAILNGKYGDYETTLVVQMFGTPAKPVVAQAAPVKEIESDEIVAKKAVAASTSAEIVEASAAAGVSISNNVPIQKAPTAFPITKTIALVTSGLLVLILAVDAFIVWHKRIVRIVSRNWAHMMMFGFLIVIISLVTKGSII